MKISLIVTGFIIAVILVIMSIFYFVHPVLILTLKDILGIIFFDALFAFGLAIYLGRDSGTKVAVWTIVGTLCIFIPIIAALIKFNKEQK